MAAYKQGYDEERFESRINQNFLCLICFNVLRDPVLCPRNQHIFCRCCIAKHLESSRRCPTCADELTLDILTEPQRIVKDYLDELNIRCEYVERGCHEVVQLQHLDRHEVTCGFKPVICTNQGCGETVSKRDIIHHETELCEFRKLKCDSCEEMTITLAEMEKRMEKMELIMETMQNKIGNVELKVANLDTKVTNVETKVEISTRELPETFTYVKGELLCNMENMKEGITKDVERTASGEKENIIVAGGLLTNSVEIFNLCRRTWSSLQSMSNKRYAATAFLYMNHVTVAGGLCLHPGYVDDIIRMNTDPNPELSTHWIDCPVKLPAKLGYHNSVLYNDQLIVTGGYDDSREATSDCIYDVQLVPPYTVKTLSRMPEPRLLHGTELFDDNILIVGGCTTFNLKHSLDSVVQYNVNMNECKQLSSLPYPVSGMATVRWGDNIVVIGGRDKQGKPLDAVVIYNIKTEQSYMLPPMKYKRFGCAAVVIGKNIVVLGGRDEQGCNLKSVEAFSSDTYSWNELTEMSEGRYFHTAVV